MNREDITALFARRADAWARLDADALAATHAADAVGVSPMQGRLEGRSRIRALYDDWMSAFPDLAFVTHKLVIDGAEVAEYFSIRGTHSAPFHGVPPTARRVDMSGAMFFTIGTDGLIAHHHAIYDVTRVLVQLGMLKTKPTPVEPARRESDLAH
jgi:steroid delta-isomerase-like uncharacterized protein